ncbi:MAG: UDP-N-acetylmuramoyl-L-alanyl-D-glutamate--2,6-diaminopimelate ligase [Rhodospirillales bacterium]|nr:UDP-N-acetylmuramoyl-L-alanyl-D-glutamate--2,6-diaminopimelate ligase [Rhodospirillales bacterium]MDP6773194.1 UDP-N-acetylmuramoyl-L-alanyl-D-glutamate--2,6-diaminopimelate ligase [Rhodospirillales bacterium]
MGGDLPEVKDEAGTANTDITGLTCDSRQVEPGFLFAALPGAQADGRAFIGEALGRGAICVLAPSGTRLPEGSPVPLLASDNPRCLFARMAARYFEKQPATIAAVTGTNGKTSVVSFARQIWTRLGRAAGSLGTLGISAPEVEAPGHLTTPDPVELHRRLRDLAQQGTECLALEASSHGLAQYRLDGVEVAVGAFTNLSRDHLDYHGTMAAYLEAKARLFRDIMKPGATAVLNADEASFPVLREIAEGRRQRVLSYGAAGADVHLDAVEPLAEGQRLTLNIEGRPHTVDLPLLGAFQASNALCALAVVLACGEDREGVVAALSHLEGVRGRVELVARHPNGAPIYVDYAHTPDALAAVLSALRSHVTGRLVVVFGCGGDRDAGKRPEMGRRAADLADMVIVTDDNPRHEAPAEIRRQIRAGCPKARDIGARRDAIGAGVSELGAGDLLVVAGKGHETGQIVGSETRPFDDAEAARAAVKELAP